MAGYLGLRDTDALRQLIDGGGIAPIVENYIAERKEYFGYIGPEATEEERRAADKKTVNPKPLHAAAQNPQNHAVMLQSAKVVLNPPFVGREFLQLMATLNFVTQAIKAAPRVFA
jgi:hypothetical protein